MQYMDSKTAGAYLVDNKLLDAAAVKGSGCCKNLL